MANYTEEKSVVTRYCVFLLVAGLPSPAISGEMPGLQPQIPPFVERDLEVTFSNDFLGRGGSVDDFRTQQMVIAAGISERWLVLLDHSILTLGDAQQAGRVDQLSASVGYRLMNKVTDHSVSNLSAGMGIRNAGDFAGERMQNGFHRLIGSDVRSLPYSDADSTDATAWFDVDHYRDLRDFEKWRTGYTAAIVRETAIAEDDLAVAMGIRFGALVVETVQQLNNDASYGQLRLVSSGKSDATTKHAIPNRSVAP